MARINIMSEPVEFDEEPARLVGWFDPDRSERFDQDTRWDGNNMVGVITGSQWIDEYLYRTPGGRWVLRHDATRYHNGGETSRFLAAEQAQEWLIRSECNDEAITRFFGEMDDEAGPGRPPVGPAFSVKFPVDLLALADAAAEKAGLSRAAWLRTVAQEALAARERDSV